ncbi:hypothetical protein KA013_01030 [Patescibacteria group bacterium]|nr:hypothetical protein [Patescibacteria group bacterium]
MVGILGGGLFYLLTVALFDLTEDGFWGASSVRVVGTVVILIVLAVVAQRAGLVSLN